MTQHPPNLMLSEWKPTRDTLHEYARIVGKLRACYMPRSKHWWHITLQVSARGLTTTPFPVADQNLELILDLAAHRLMIASSEGWEASHLLTGQSAARLCRWIDRSLTAAHVELEPDLLASFDGEAILPYDAEASGRFREVINWVDAAFRTFKNGLREETSPVQLFPHHMDIALNWFSGRLNPGVDPADEESADEQMNFGFVTGDELVPDAYFYATAYPSPEEWTTLTLPKGAYWHTDGWTGAILPYAVVAGASSPLEMLLEYLRSLQAHGAELMGR